MKHTMKVYKNSAEHGAYLKARFDKNNTGQSFEWGGHRWAYDGTTFDDSGDYDLLYRFDDKPYPEEVTVTTDDMTIRDYFAAKAMQGMLSNPEWNHFSTQQHAEYAYGVADAMLKARGGV